MLIKKLFKVSIIIIYDNLFFYIYFRFYELKSTSTLGSTSPLQKEFNTLANSEAREVNKIIAPIFGKDSFVDKYLESVAIQNKNLALLRSHKTLLRQDHETLVDCVKILSGGAAIADPLYSGSIGEGMLTGAIFGTLKKSPPSLTILEVLRIMARKNTQGILVIVSNNLANRLNFGSACQNAAKEGIKTLLINVGDDVSGVSVGKTVGRKGLCGIKFLFKIAGAMSEEKRTLQEIYHAIEQLKGSSLGSINVEISLDKMVVGFSSKGEPEKEPSIWDTVDDIREFSHMSYTIRQALSYLFSPISYFSLHVVKGDDVVVIVNNMGDLTDFYMSLIVNEVLGQIKLLGMNTIRLYPGRFSNSSIAGFTISVLKVKDNTTLELLDRPTAATSWAENSSVVNTELNLISELPSAPESYIPHLGERKGVGPKFTEQETTYLLEVLSRVVENVKNLEEYLNELDIDHDFGTAVHKFAEAVQMEINNRTLKTSSPYEFLDQMSYLSGFTMGGVAGGIFSIMLSSAAQVFQTSSPMSSVDMRMWVDAARAARDGLQKFTRVKPGDGTILDALDPFVEAPDEISVRGLSRRVSAAVKGAEGTTRTSRASLRSSIRSSIHSGSLAARRKSTVPEGEAGAEKKPRAPDPGALCLATIIRTIFTFLQIELAESEVQAEADAEARRRESRGSRRSRGGTFAEEEQGDESRHTTELRGTRQETEVRGTRHGTVKTTRFGAHETVTESKRGTHLQEIDREHGTRLRTELKHGTQLQETEGERGARLTIGSKRGTQLQETDGERGTRLTIGSKRGTRLRTELKHGTQLQETDGERGTRLTIGSKRGTQLQETGGERGTRLRTELKHGTQLEETDGERGTRLTIGSKRGTRLRTELKHGTQLQETDGERGTRLTIGSKQGSRLQETDGERGTRLGTQLKHGTQLQESVDERGTHLTKTEPKHGTHLQETNGERGTRLATKHGTELVETE